jgi:3-oxoadipate enol-lactonase
VSTPPYRPLLNLGDGFAGREVKADGAGVLWLHGYALDSSSWGELWDLLPRFHHVGIDLPAHGRSLPLGEKEQLPDLAARLVKLAEKRNLRHLMALSASTLLAMEMACQKPEAFDSLVLGSPLPPDGAAGEPFWGRYRELVNMQRMGGYGEHLRGRLMLVEPTMFEGAKLRDGLWDRLWSLVGQHPFLDLEHTEMIRLGSGPDEVRLNGMRVPTLLVVGARDVLSGRRHAERLEKVIQGSRRLDVMGAERLALLEAPSVAAAAVEAHVGAHHGRKSEELR